MFIRRNAEGVHAYLSKCWRGTYASVGMLNGYMVRERLGTPRLTKWYWNPSLNSSKRQHK